MKPADRPTMDDIANELIDITEKLELVAKIEQQVQELRLQQKQLKA